MEKRAIMAFVLALIVIILWPIITQKLNLTKPKEKSLDQEKEQTLTTSQISRQEKPQSSLLPGTSDEKKELLTIIETPLYMAEISSYGATIKSWKLKNYKTTIEKDAQQIELVNVEKSTRRPLSIDLSSLLNESLRDLSFEMDKEYLTINGVGESKKLTCTAFTKNGVRIEKIYTFYADNYLFEFLVSVQNLTEKPLTGDLGIAWTYKWDQSIKSSRWEGHNGPIGMIHNKREEVDTEDIAGTMRLPGEVAWAGVENKYFISLLVPRVPNQFSWSIENTNNLISSTLWLKQVEIPSERKLEVPLFIYSGPKEIDSLKASGLGLEKALRFGWLDFIAKPLLLALRFFNKYLGNYGLAIIVLTIIIKILFFPLATKSYKSMKEMQRIQPRIAKIRERFKSNKEQLNREVMQLYRTHKVNPMGGCLPMVLQIPVFFALYYTLLGAIELRHAPFFFWIHDLSAKDPYYITPLIMGASMFLQQKMTPTAADPLQAKIMLLMPVFFTFLFLNFPSGLVIYWFVNNVLSISQQLYINKYGK